MHNMLLWTNIDIQIIRVFNSLSLLKLCFWLCFLQVYGLPWTKRRHTWTPPRCTAWMWRSSSNSGRESVVRVLCSVFLLCVFPGVRSPMNQATSYLDSSQVYGVDVEEQLKLRAGVGGTCFCANSVVFLQVYNLPWTKRRHTWIPPRCTAWMWRNSSNSGPESAVRVFVLRVFVVFISCFSPNRIIHCVPRAQVSEVSSRLYSLCPKSPSARGLVACLPVRLLFKSTKHNAFYPV